MSSEVSHDNVTKPSEHVDTPTTPATVPAAQEQQQQSPSHAAEPATTTNVTETAAAEPSTTQAAEQPTATTTTTASTTVAELDTLSARLTSINQELNDLKEKEVELSKLRDTLQFIEKSTEEASAKSNKTREDIASMKTEIETSVDVRVVGELEVQWKKLSALIQKKEGHVSGRRLQVDGVKRRLEGLFQNRRTFLESNTTSLDEVASSLHPDVLDRHNYVSETNASGCVDILTDVAVSRELTRDECVQEITTRAKELQDVTAKISNTRSEAEQVIREIFLERDDSLSRIEQEWADEKAKLIAAKEVQSQVAREVEHLARRRRGTAVLRSSTTPTQAPTILWKDPKVKPLPQRHKDVSSSMALVPMEHGGVGTVSLHPHLHHNKMHSPAEIDSVHSEVLALQKCVEDTERTIHELKHSILGLQGSHAQTVASYTKEVQMKKEELEGARATRAAAGDRNVQLRSERASKREEGTVQRREASVRSSTLPDRGIRPTTASLIALETYAKDNNGSNNNNTNTNNANGKFLATPDRLGMGRSVASTSMAVRTSASERDEGVKA